MRQILMEAETDYDIEKIVELRMQYFKEIHPNIDGNVLANIQSKTISYANNHLGKDLIIAGSFIGGIAVSCAWMNIFERAPNIYINNGTFAEIYSVYTVPEMRLHGLAAAEINMLVQFAKRNNISRIDLHAASDKLSMYEKLGFSINDLYRPMHLQLLDSCLEVKHAK